MEKFVLGGILTGNELNIVHQEQVCFPVLGAESQVIAGFNGGNQFVDELVALDIDPLVMSAGGTPYRAFLEGRVEGDRYALILRMTNLELKEIPVK